MGGAFEAHGARGKESAGQKRKKSSGDSKNGAGRIEGEAGEGEDRGSEGKARFFKVFLPHCSSDRLRIPPAFEQHLHKEAARTSLLEGPSGHAWHVEIVESSDGLFFESGWKEFITDHSITAGDFLVFEYDGSSRFSVLLFDASACEKESALRAQPSQWLKVKTEEVEGCVEAGTKTVVAALSSPHTSLGGKVRHRHHHHQAIIPISSSAKGFPCSPESVCKDGSHKNAVKPVGSLTLKASRNVTRRGQTVAKVQRLPVLISQRRPVTEEEVSMTLERAKSFVSDNPFTLMVMRDSYVYVGFYMALPSSFVRNHIPVATGPMTLLDPSGKPWKVIYIYNEERGLGAFSGGWGTFALGNNLERDDVCIFELVKPLHMQVHIFRVVGEVTPLVRRAALKHGWTDSLTGTIRRIK